MSLAPTHVSPSVRSLVRNTSAHKSDGPLCKGSYNTSEGIKVEKFENRFFFAFLDTQVSLAPTHVSPSVRLLVRNKSAHKSDGPLCKGSYNTSEGIKVKIISDDKL